MAGAPAAANTSSLVLDDTYPDFRQRLSKPGEALEELAAHPECFDIHSGIAAILNFREIDKQGCSEAYLKLAEDHLASGLSSEPESEFLAALVYFQDQLTETHTTCRHYLDSKPPETDNISEYISAFNEAMACITDPIEFLRLRPEPSHIHIQTMVEMLFESYREECQPFFEKMELAFQDPATRLSAYLVYEPLTRYLSTAITGADFESARHTRLADLSKRAAGANTYPKVEALFGTLDIKTLATLARNFASLAGDQALYADLLLPIIVRLVNTMQAMSKKPGREMANEFLPSVMVYCNFPIAFYSAETYLTLLQCFSVHISVKFLECSPDWDIESIYHVDRHIQRMHYLQSDTHPLIRLARQRLERHMQTTAETKHVHFLLAAVVLKLNSSDYLSCPLSEALIAQYPQTAFYIETMIRNSVEIDETLEYPVESPFEETSETDCDELPETDKVVAKALRDLWSREFTTTFNELASNLGSCVFFTLRAYLQATPSNQLSTPSPSPTPEF